MPNTALSSLRSVAKEILPPILQRSLRKESPYGWFGEYATWEEATAHASGYDQEDILQRVIAATNQVISGNAAYERDTVLFEDIEFEWPFLSCLLLIALANQNNLSVIDFGGSLGSRYYQHRSALSALNALRWNIIEQPHFVEYGREYLADTQLQFYPTIANCLEKETPQVVAFSCVLQYLPQPYEVLQQVVAQNIPYLLLDRTSFSNTGKTELTVQHVNPAIYEASYPCWLFGRNELLDWLAPYYELKTTFDSTPNVSPRFELQGMLLERRH